MVNKFMNYFRGVTWCIIIDIYMLTCKISDKIPHNTSLFIVPVFLSCNWSTNVKTSSGTLHPLLLYFRQYIVLRKL